ncbi:UPF0058 family protein [Halorutilales archaeon Cl-col2-1]
MQKDEVIHIHALLHETMEFLEKNDLASFDDSSLDVRPTDVHKPKEEHEKAVFALGNQLADAMAEDEFSDIGRVRQRMKELIEERN